MMSWNGKAETVMQQVEAVELTERARRLREHYFACHVQVATERAQIAVDAWWGARRAFPGASILR